MNRDGRVQSSMGNDCGQSSLFFQDLQLDFVGSFDPVSSGCAVGES